MSTSLPGISVPAVTPSDATVAWSSTMPPIDTEPVLTELIITE